MTSVSCIQYGTRILDSIKEQFDRENPTQQILERFSAELYSFFYRNLPRTEWEQFIIQTRDHPLKKIMHEDPFMRRAYQKPKGYAGDAETIDFIYSSVDGRIIPAYEQASARGREICDYFTTITEAQAVRARRRIILEVIEDLVHSLPNSNVLSVACGYLREAKVSEAVRTGRLGTFRGIDSDPDSVAVVNGYEYQQVSARELSVQGMMREKNLDPKPDLIYSLGLFDYLSDRFSRKLINHLFTMLAPGGKCYIANFLPTSDTAIREWVSEWYLIHRSEEQLLDLAANLPENAGIHEILVEENQAVGFLIIEKLRGSVRTQDTAG